MNYLSLSMTSLPDVCEFKSISSEKETYQSLESLIPRNIERQAKDTQLAYRSLSQVSVCSDSLYIEDGSDAYDTSTVSSGCEELSIIEKDGILHEQEILHRKRKGFQCETNALKRMEGCLMCAFNYKEDLGIIRRNPLVNETVIRRDSKERFWSSRMPAAGKLMSHVLGYNPSFVQKGETCRLFAFSTVYNYFHNLGFCSYMQAYKTQEQIDSGGRHWFMADKGAKSIREYAKKTGSAQGEFVSPERLKILADSLGFHSHTVVPEDLGQYISFIVDNIDNGIPVVIFYQADHLLSPDGNIAKQWGECAVVAIGYDLRDNTICVIDHGYVRNCDMKKLWDAASAINRERRVEIFARKDPENGVLFVTGRRDVKLHERKWFDMHRMYDEGIFQLCVDSKVCSDIDDVVKLESSSCLRRSIEPTATDPGFNRTLMIFYPADLYPEKKE